MEEVKAKVSLNYILLILPLITVILPSRRKETSRSTVEKEESELADICRLTAKVYMSILIF